MSEEFWKEYVEAYDKGFYREEGVIVKLPMWGKKKGKHGLLAERLAPSLLASYFNDLIDYMRKQPASNEKKGMIVRNEEQIRKGMKILEYEIERASNQGDDYGEELTLLNAWHWLLGEEPDDDALDVSKRLSVERTKAHPASASTTTDNEGSEK